MDLVRSCLAEDPSGRPSPHEALKALHVIPEGKSRISNSFINPRSNISVDKGDNSLLNTSNKRKRTLVLSPRKTIPVVRRPWKPGVSFDGKDEEPPDPMEE
jgi:hypothetical protein